ncbi:MAG: hypothetical protein NTV34_09755 [Proteobacteria bacterium]|nr:hypothetical protein [Pseudomonadota bacterium]
MAPYDTEQNGKSVQLLLPNITFPSEVSIRINDSEMAMSTRSRQARVLRFFWNNPSGVLKRECLIELLHKNNLDLNVASIQFEGSLWRNSHQVMSRLRRTMGFCFAKHMPIGTEWLPYCSNLSGWILYKLPGYGSDGGWHQ